MTKEIIEGNKLIAEFLGQEKLTGRISDEHRQFHTSWDWLMPVCKKLDYLAENGVIKFTDAYQQHCDKLDDSVTRTYDITPVWLVVVDFIKWYNQTQTK